MVLFCEFTKVNVSLLWTRSKKEAKGPNVPNQCFLIASSVQSQLLILNFLLLLMHHQFHRHVVHSQKSMLHVPLSIAKQMISLRLEHQKENKYLPLLVWLSGLSASLWSESLPFRLPVWLQVRFPVRAHIWVAAQVPGWGCARGIRLMFLSPPSLPFFLSRKLFKNHLFKDYEPQTMTCEYHTRSAKSSRNTEQGQSGANALKLNLISESDRVWSKGGNC